MMKQSNKLEKGFEILDELMPELNENQAYTLRIERLVGKFLSVILRLQKDNSYRHAGYNG